MRESAPLSARRAASNLLFCAIWRRCHIERVALPPDTRAALADGD
jgi:hypothetical protein